MALDGINYVAMFGYGTACRDFLMVCRCFPGGRICSGAILQSIPEYALLCLLSLTCIDLQCFAQVHAALVAT